MTSVLGRAPRKLTELPSFSVRICRRLFTFQIFAVPSSAPETRYEPSGRKASVVMVSRCRTPVVFLLGEWRPGAGGAWTMGLRHGLLCVGCCWALMALLFVGGAMNLAWVAALAIVVAIEKMAPKGERVAFALGVVLLAAGAGKLVSLLH